MDFILQLLIENSGEIIALVSSLISACVVRYLEKEKLRKEQLLKDKKYYKKAYNGRL